ncbi:MAG: hypothetical protein R3D56_00740 [Paracoccaceae bacterium]
MILSDRMAVMDKGESSGSVSPTEVYGLSDQPVRRGLHRVDQLRRGDRSVGLGDLAQSTSRPLADACRRVPCRALPPGERLTLAVRPEKHDQP